MNRISKQISVFVIGFALFFYLIGRAGESEYIDQVVYTMPQEAYEQIVIELGDQDTSNFQIAKRYLNNKKYYDSLSNN